MFEELKANLLRRVTEPVKRELHQAVDDEIARLEAACEAAAEIGDMRNGVGPVRGN